MPVIGGCKPYRTTLMIEKGVDWSNIAGNWYMVCTMCGGNCGQCSLTGYVDNVATSMDHLIVNTIGGNPNG